MYFRYERSQCFLRGGRSQPLGSSLRKREILSLRWSTLTWIWKGCKQLQKATILVVKQCQLPWPSLPWTIPSSTLAFPSGNSKSIIKRALITVNGDIQTGFANQLFGPNFGPGLIGVMITYELHENLEATKWSKSERNHSFFVYTWVIPWPSAS